MEYVTAGFKPEKVLRFFEEICAIPHGSRDTKRISDYVVNFAKERGLKYYQDDNNNVVIYKPGSKGNEEKESIILQGHLDMVCEKDDDADIDFKKDGLKLYIENEMLKAKGTTLGADDGIAVAMCLAILDSDLYVHPPIEAVFTVDEEIGMLGAAAFDFSVLKSKMMINIDSEDEGIFTVGCAGGMTVKVFLPVKRIASGSSGEIIRLSLTGFLGGHSGQEINKGRANPNVMLGRLLYELSDQISFGIMELSGGLKDNAIPRSARAYLSVSKDETGKLSDLVSTFEKKVQKEFAVTDPDISISVSKASDDEINALMENEMDEESAKRVICALFNMPFGVLRMSPEISGLVETSLNMGILETASNEVKMTFSVRSSIESEKKEVFEKIKCLTESLGGNVEVSGEYPAWEYKKDSLLRKTAVDVFKEQYKKKPVIEAIHAGLECGLFAGAIEGIDIISIGPDLKDIHTPKETMDIKSVERTFEFLLRLLSRLSEGKLSKSEIKDLIDRGNEHIKKRVAYYAPLVGVTYGRVCVKKIRSRWGSCSSKGNLNFNCLLMLTPDEVIDSVVVHELCHRKHMDHSKEFYDEVLRVFPDYRKWDKYLKDNGRKLLERISGEDE